MQVLDTLTCSFEHYNEWRAARMSSSVTVRMLGSDGVKLLFQRE